MFLERMADTMYWFIGTHFCLNILTFVWCRLDCLESCNFLLIQNFIHDFQTFMWCIDHEHLTIIFVFVIIVADFNAGNKSQGLIYSL